MCGGRAGQVLAKAKQSGQMTNISKFISPHSSEKGINTCYGMSYEIFLGRIDVGSPGCPVTALS